MAELLSQFSLNESVHRYCSKKLREKSFQETILKTSSKLLLQKEHKQQQTKLDNLLEMRLNNEIDAELFIQKKQCLNERLQDVVQQLKRFESADTNWLEQTENFLKLASQAKVVFQNGNLQRKREILKFVSSHIILIEGKLEFKLRKPFNILAIQDVDKNNELQQNPVNEAEFTTWFSRLELISTFFLNASPPFHFPRLAD